MGWVSPTGHNDPSSGWGNETNAYDADTATYAWSLGTTQYLELTLGSAINCDKVRIYAERYTSGVAYDHDLDVDVYYSGSWHNIHSGTVTKNTWVELTIGSTQSVAKARVKSNDIASRRVKEFEFNEVVGGTTHYGAATLGGVGALATLAKLTLVAKAALVGQGLLATIGCKILTGASTLAGTGALAAIGAKTLTGAATLTGEGALAAIGTIEGAIKYAAATLAGAGSLAAAGVTVLSGASTLAGTGSLAASAGLTLAAKALLSGVASLAAIGTLLGEVFASATLAGSGSLSVLAESWHILTSQEYQDLLEGHIEFQEI